MDGSTSKRVGPQVDVEARVRQIKDHMPEVYRAIQDKAEDIGREAYAMVRRAIAGQPNTFYAFERGYVVGTPFSKHDITADLAMAMVAFGTTYAVVWAEPQAKEAADGAH